MFSPVLCGFLIVALLGVFVARKFKKTGVKKGGPFLPEGPEIVPVGEDFAWEKTALRKFRPFKSKYNLTMGITKPDHQDWLLLEHSYLDRINHHKAILEKDQGKTTCLCNGKDAELAVREIYDYSVSFMAARYPQYFRPLAGGDMILNTILNTTLPATSVSAVKDGASANDLLRILGEHIEEDFLLMGFDPEVGEYRLRACTGIAANGFTWDTRMNLKLTDLHGPIPRYKEKLQFSMNKYFRSMMPGDIVQRSTYKVQVSDHDALYLPDGNNDIDPASSKDLGHLAFMRLERQQLTRLKKSNFIVFTLRTYMYPLSDIKAEGLGPAMAEAMRAWPEDFAKYKHRQDWGEAVFGYLDDL